MRNKARSFEKSGRDCRFFIIFCVFALVFGVICGVCLLTVPEPIAGLPAAEDIARITVNHTEVRPEDEKEWLPIMLEMFGKATKTNRSSYSDMPERERLDDGVYLAITFYYADETYSPSYQTYYLYQVDGKAYLERPYDAVYRLEDGFYGRISAYFSELSDKIRE